MIEPILTLQTAIRASLIRNPKLIALVPATNIRSGSTRPDMETCIILSDGSTSLHGYDYTAQRTAWAYLDLHIWTLNAGQDAAKEIAGVVMATLAKDNIAISGGYCDQFRIVNSRFPRDPDPQYGHGILSVEALIRWII